MRVAVVVFPGTNCDHDTLHVFGALLSSDAYVVWHRDRDLGTPDIVVLPGGFAHGDYLRTGALAKLSPVMTVYGNLRTEVEKFWESATGSRFYAKPDFFRASF